MPYDVDAFVEHCEARTWNELTRECVGETERTDRLVMKKGASYELKAYNRRLGRPCYFLQHRQPPPAEMTAEDDALYARIREKFGQRQG